MNIAKYKKQ